MEEPVPTPKAGLTAAVQTGMGDPGVNSVSTVFYLKGILRSFYMQCKFARSLFIQCKCTA